MDTDKYGSHILLTILLIPVIFLSLCSVPGRDAERPRHKISKKAQTRVGISGVAENTPKKETGESAAEKEPENELPAEKKKPAGTVQPTVTDMDGKPSENKGKTAAGIDIIEMNNPLYKTHKKGIVRFTHKKHIEVYGIGCGQCHHDESGKGLELGPEDTVQGCIECHRETIRPKGEKLDKKTRIMTYHFEALHANCIGCHKAFNIEKGDPKGKGPAPTSCTACHPRKK